MLEALRRGSQGIVVKLLMAILILSFAVWGVADVFTGFGRSSIAEVGDTKITPDQYQRAYQNELNAISYRAGRRITADQARAFGLDNQVLQRLIASAAVDQHASDLKLALADAALVEGLKRDPAFHGADGKYSRAAVENIMRELGLSEAGFLALRRKEEIRRQLTSALTESVVVPQAMIELMHAWREETRTLQHLTIDADKVVAITPPDEAKLKATYDANKQEFMTPPMRKLQVLVLSVDALKQRVTISDADVKAAYEHEKAIYDTPEKRRVQQISFPDRAAADAAKKDIDGGKSFADVAKDRGAKESDIDLGLITQKQLIDPKIAEAAFQLAKDAVSSPIEGRFATVLLRVTAIESGTQSTFETVKDKVRDKLAAEKARVEVHKYHDEVDDGRAGGRPLKDIAEQTKLAFHDIAATDRSGKTPDGKLALEVADAARIIAAGFEAQIGVERDPVELGDGGYAWVDVLSITPAAEKAFDAVKDDAKVLYEKNERDRQLRERADKLVERLKAGEAIEAVAGDAGGAKVETTTPITRNTTPQGLGRNAVALAFTLPKGGAGSADSADGRSRSVFVVSEITAAKPATEEQALKISKELEGNLQNDAIAAYVGALQSQMGVSVNQAEFDRLRGANAP